MEADVVNTWIGFLENTWTLQTSYIEDREKQVKYVIHFPQSASISAALHTFSHKCMRKMEL